MNAGRHSILPSLAGARWLCVPQLARVIAALKAESGGARIVGGAVRNALLGRPVHEVDIATDVTPPEAVRLCQAAGLKVVETGVEHGTVTVIADGMPFEVTTLRRDVETDGRRAVVAFTTDWTEDAERRDFTINAIYADHDGQLYDPIGGYPDIAAHCVRFIGDPHDRIREDYLRILRLFRFHAEIGRGAADAAGLAAASELRDGLAGLSRERVNQELMRLLAAHGAGDVVPVMQTCGIFAALDLGDPDIARFTSLVAIEATLGRADPLLRLAALFLAPQRGRDAEALAERLRLSRAEAERLDGLSGWHEVSPQLHQQARRALVYHTANQAAHDRVLIAWAASGAPGDDRSWRALADFAADWSAPKFPLKGRDLMALGMSRGPGLGVALAELEQYWIDSDFQPDRDQLLAHAAAVQHKQG